MKNNYYVFNLKFINQYQGLDAIIEEVNKALKTLSSPVPTQKHWEIAARNCIDFMKVSDISKLLNFCHKIANL